MLQDFSKNSSPYYLHKIASGSPVIPVST